MRSSVILLFFVTFISNVLMIVMQLDENFGDVEFQQKLFDPKHSECLKKYLNHTVLEEELIAAMTENTLPLFMENNCPKWHNAVQCYDVLVAELKPHWNFLQKIVFQSLKGMIRSSIAFICENNGKHFLDFIAKDGLECLIENQEQVKHCLNFAFEEDIMNMITTDEGNLPQINLKPATFSGFECKILRNVTDCILDEVRKSCSNHSQVFIHDFVFGLFQKTPCADWLSDPIFMEWEHYLLAALLPKHIPVKDRICANNSTALDVAQQSMQNASKCWNEVIDNSFLWEDAKQAYEHRTHVAFLKKYCPKVQSLSSCIGDFMDSMQQCVSGEDSVTLDATKDVVEGLVSFLCHRYGERILLFMKEEGLDCLDKQQDNIQQCMEGGEVYELLQSVDADLNPIQVLNNLWVPQNYRPEECRVIVALEVCVYKHMINCKRRTPANLISSLIRAVARRSPCWKIAKNFSSGALFMPNIWTLSAAVSLVILSCFAIRIYEK